MSTSRARRTTTRRQRRRPPSRRVREQALAAAMSGYRQLGDRMDAPRRVRRTSSASVPLFRLPARHAGDRGDAGGAYESSLQIASLHSRCTSIGQERVLPSEAAKDSCVKENSGSAGSVLPGGRCKCRVDLPGTLDVVPVKVDRGRRRMAKVVTNGGEIGTVFQ